MYRILLIAFLCPSIALAWGQNGHRITGAIATSLLTPETITQIETIIGNESLAEASTWPDYMRSNTSEFWRKSSPFHYVTVPPGKHYHDVGAPEQGDAMTALNQFTATLRSDTASSEEKATALRFVVHIIGDLHQPLHAGNGSDRGGNDVKLSYFGESSNLHRVWDTQMIEGQNLSYTEYTAFLQRHLNQEQIAEWQDLDPATWIKESTVLRDTLYPETDKLYYSYPYQHIGSVNERLSQAGVRIAYYLNAVWQE